MIQENMSEKMQAYLNKPVGTADPLSKWDFGNQILYEMCEQYPLHIDENTIIGKVWLIGRSYAAAIERTKKKITDADDFYFNVVANGMIAIGEELDQKIKSLQDAVITWDNLDEILKVHKFLVDVFDEMTGLEKRSLASKYLHFHCPSMFYIFDSRAESQIKRIVKKQGIIKKQFDIQFSRLDDCDKQYADFCIRMLIFQETIYKEYGKRLTPRELDDLLLFCM